jgi:Type II secretion system (T2SS), protein N
LLGLLAFALTLLALMPMRWVSAFIPDNVQCEQWRGSLWHGQCNGLRVNIEPGKPLELPSMQWTLQPSALFALALQAKVQAQLPAGQADAVVRVQPGGRLQLKNVSATLPFDRSLFNMLPPDLTGQVVIVDATLGLKDKNLTALAGQIQLRNFTDASGSQYGSYRLSFEPAATAPFNGTLTDTGGPLSVDAKLAVAEDRSWTIQGTVAARDASNANLARRLDLVGSPDASGRRTLRAEGSFN